MAEIKPLEAVLGSGAGGPLTAPSPWVAFEGYIQYSQGVVVGSPAGGNEGNGSINAAAIYINGVAVTAGNLANYLPLAGGVMTGLLTLSGPPTANLHAATKQYVDGLIASTNAGFANFLPLAGGILTGFLTLNADPTTNLEAATKQYVDNKTGNVINIPDAPSDGSTYGRNNAAWTNVLDAGTF
jgi:hypothetical protein